MLEKLILERSQKISLSFKYKNAQGQDLWDAIGKASKMPVSAMVNSWLKQPGFPQVEINQNDNNLVLKQSRFLMEPTAKTQ